MKYSSFGFFVILLTFCDLNFSNCKIGSKAVCPKSVCPTRTQVTCDSADILFSTAGNNMISYKNDKGIATSSYCGESKNPSATWLWQLKSDKKVATCVQKNTSGSI